MQRDFCFFAVVRSTSIGISSDGNRIYNRALVSIDLIGFGRIVPAMLRLNKIATLCAGLLVMAGLLFPALAQSIPVPPGNRNAKQPAIPYGAVSRTRATNGSFEAKYSKIRNTLASDRKLMGKIKKAASRYRIEPIHIVGALIGEHTYNVDALDRLQTYYVKAMSYLGSDISFKYDSEHVTNFVSRPQFAKCSNSANSYDLWTCRERIWDTVFRGKLVSGTNWPNDRFGKVFFQPLYAGQTFGLGQLNPLTALQANDLVRQVSRLPKLSANQAPKVYSAIMDPDSTLHYMAAIIRISIDAYSQITGFDISTNPGVTATLYNLGDVKSRAYQLRAKNNKRKAAGQQPLWPEENYYGWLVNEKLADLQSIIR